MNNFQIQGFIKLTSADNILCADLINAKMDSINWGLFDKRLLYEYPRAGGEQRLGIN